MSLLLKAAGDTELIKEAIKTSDEMRALHERSMLQLFPSNDDVNRAILRLIKSDHDLYRIFLTCKGFYSYITDELLWNYRIIQWYGFDLSPYVLKYGASYKDYYNDLSNYSGSSIIILAAEHGWISLFKKHLSELITESLTISSPDDSLKIELPADYSSDSDDDDDIATRVVRAAFAKMTSCNPLLRLMALSLDCLVASMQNNHIEILNIILDEYYDRDINKTKEYSQIFDVSLLLNCNIEILDRLSRSNTNRLFSDAATEAISQLINVIIPNTTTVDHLPRLGVLLKFDRCHYSIVPKRPLDEKISDMFIAHMPLGQLKIILPWLHPNGIKLLLRTKIPITGEIIYQLMRELKENLTEILVSLSDIIPSGILGSYNPLIGPILINALPKEFIYTNLGNLRVEDLKLILKRKGLKMTGKKADLLQRIYDSQNK